MAALLDAVVIDPPADLIAERQRLGLDKHDEVWEGVYHMVPTGSGEHQRTIFELGMCLDRLAKAAGLQMRHEWNLIAPREPGWNDFRVPDLVVCTPETYSERGAVGPVALVVEIRSPGDESFKKLPHYERFGVDEVLIIDRDTKVVRHWIRDGDALVESAGDDHGHHQLRCLPVELWCNEGQLLAATEDGTTPI